MSGKIEREIEEILRRLEEPVPGEDAPDPERGSSLDRAANLRRAIASRLAGVSMRRIMLASLALVVIVAAGLFFGLVYPSLGDSATGAGSTDGAALHEGAGDDIGEAVHEDDVGREGSVEGEVHPDGEEGHDEVDRPSEPFEEHESRERH